MFENTKGFRWLGWNIFTRREDVHIQSQPAASHAPLMEYNNSLDYVETTLRLRCPQRELLIAKYFEFLTDFRFCFLQFDKRWLCFDKCCSSVSKTWLQLLCRWRRATGLTLHRMSVNIRRFSKHRAALWPQNDIVQTRTLAVRSRSHLQMSHKLYFMLMKCALTSCVAAKWRYVLRGKSSVIKSFSLVELLCSRKWFYSSSCFMSRSCTASWS